MITARLFKDGWGLGFFLALLLLAAAVPVCNLILPPTSPFHMPDWFVRSEEHSLNSSHVD